MPSFCKYPAEVTDVVMYQSVQKYGPLEQKSVLTRNKIHTVMINRYLSLFEASGLVQAVLMSI